MNDEGFKLIGYSSDYEGDNPYENRTFSKDSKRSKQASLNLAKILWHKYSFNGQVRYYKIPITILPNWTKVIYHGEVLKRFNGNPDLDVMKGDKKDKSGKCCYCEIKLTEKNYTREHVIPKRVGGKIIKPCCNLCNTEKGGLMLHHYIMVLNQLALDSKPNTEAYLRLQTKIKNANRIAIEIEKK